LEEKYEVGLPVLGLVDGMFDVGIDVDGDKGLVDS